MCNMYIWGEYGGGMGWNETGWVFRGDAKLAHSAVWLDVFVEGRDFCLGGDAELAQERGLAGVWLWKDGTFVLGGRGIGAGARFRWMCL